MNLLEINDKQYELLKRSYLQAVENQEEQFLIDGQPVLTKFAKYWLEAIENKRKSRGERIYEPKKHDIKCQKCGYTWTSRIEGKPKVCPRCKNRLDK